MVLLSKNHLKWEPASSEKRTIEEKSSKKQTVNKTYSNHWSIVLSRPHRKENKYHCDLRPPLVMIIPKPQSLAHQNDSKSRWCPQFIMAGKSLQFIQGNGKVDMLGICGGTEVPSVFRAGLPPVFAKGAPFSSFMIRYELWSCRRVVSSSIWGVASNRLYGAFL